MSICVRVVSSENYADVMSILALSSVVGLRIQMFFPRLTPSLEAHPLTRCLVGRGMDDMARSIVVTWTSLDNATLPIIINHFVPLCKIVVNVAAAETVSDDSSGDGDKPDGDGSDDGRDDGDDNAELLMDLTSTKFKRKMLMIPMCQETMMLTNNIKVKRPTTISLL